MDQETQAADPQRLARFSSRRSGLFDRPRSAQSEGLAGGRYGALRPNRVLVLAVRFYQATLSSLFGGHCRYVPSCSEYAIQALSTHGAVRGLWLTVRRLLRCHPLGGAGYDPVPGRRSDARCAMRDVPD